jgi:hypothetical protein
MKFAAIAVAMMWSWSVYAGCTPKTDKVKPTICIDNKTGDADRSPAYAYVGAKIKFKFSSGGKIKVTPADPNIVSGCDGGVLFSDQCSGKAKTEGKTDYTVTDLRSAKSSDPTIIIEPIAPVKKHRQMRKD